jgi:hypothetical protein
MRTHVPGIDDSGDERVPRPVGCECHQEEGDSPCPVHGEECETCCGTGWSTGVYAPNALRTAGSAFKCKTCSGTGWVGGS